MKELFDQILVKFEVSNPSIYRHIREFLGSRTGAIMAHRIRSVDWFLKAVMYAPETFAELEKSHPAYTWQLRQRRGFPWLYGCPEWTVTAMHCPYPFYGELNNRLGLYTEDPRDPCEGLGGG